MLLKRYRAARRFGVAPIEKVLMNIKAKTPLNGCLFCIAWDCFQNQSLARVKDSENSIHGVVFKKIVHLTILFMGCFQNKPKMRGKVRRNPPQVHELGL